MQVRFSYLREVALELQSNAFTRNGGAYATFSQSYECWTRAECGPRVICTHCFGRSQRRCCGGDRILGRGLGENDPEKVLPFYANDAVLWGTLSPTVRADQAALRDYFVTAFKVLPGLKVSFGDQLVRVYGTTAVNTGYYTFSYVQNGEAKTLPARYSFTYVQSGDRWLIVDHHSSAMPPAPR